MNHAEDPKRVLVIDSFPLFRDGLCAAIERSEQFSLAGQAGNAADGCGAVERERPDLLIMCLQLGATDGLEFIKQLRAIVPAMRILIVSTLDEDVWALRALNAGADGYIMKISDAQTVLNALDHVARGETWLSPRITAQIVRRACGKESLAKPETLEVLSDRELHVFKLIGTGLGSRQIAEELHLSIKTIETYRANIRVKLGFQQSSEVVACARTWVERTDGQSGQRISRSA